MFRNLLCLLSFYSLLYTAQANEMASLFTNSLGYDQTMEKISLYVDDNLIGTLDLKKPNAEEGTLAFPIIKDISTYRLTGLADIDGDEYTITGAGLLISESQFNLLFNKTVPLTQLFSTYIDILAQIKKSIAQVVTKEELNYLTELEVTRLLTQDTSQAIDATEKRLTTSLPASLTKFLTEIGTLHIGGDNYDRFHLFSAAEIVSVAHWLSEKSEEGQSDRLTALIKRHPAAAKDLVIGISNGEEPIILRVDSKVQCQKNQLPLSLPGSNIDLLLANDGLITVIANYYQVVVTNDECYDLTSLYKAQLIEHIDLTLSEFITILSPKKHYDAYREFTDDTEMKVWIRFDSLD